MQAAELDAALSRDDTARYQQAISGQQRVRVSAIIALAVAAILIRAGGLVPIAIAASVAGAYALVVLRAGVTSVRSQAAARRGAVTLSAADAVAVSALCGVAAGGGATDTLFWILIAGGLAAPAMAFAFGSRSAVVSLALFAAGYIGFGLLYAGFGIGTVTGMTSIATVALWGTGVWLLIRYLGVVRNRLDWLRTYAKLAEVGDVGTAEMISDSEGSDDFALLARSFDAVHSRLAEQIGSDPLTGCANRRGLERQLLGVCRLARRREGTVAVAAIDIDHFKQINDTHGHPEGDRVLRQLAIIMISTARDSDTVARLGGDEFVVILPDSDWSGSRSFAERLRDRVREASFGPPGTPIAITISIGVAVAQGKAQLEPDRLLGEADQALYEAKAGGRDRVSAHGAPRSSVG